MKIWQEGGGGGGGGGGSATTPMILPHVDYFSLELDFVIMFRLYFCFKSVLFYIIYQAWLRND